VKLLPVSNRPETKYITGRESFKIFTGILSCPLDLETLSLLKTVSTSSLATDLNSKIALTDRSRYSSNLLLLGGILDISVPIF
jgi:hypothetical protein